MVNVAFEQALRDNVPSAFHQPPKIAKDAPLASQSCRNYGPRSDTWNHGKRFPKAKYP